MRTLSLTLAITLAMARTWTVKGADDEPRGAPSTDCGLLALFCLLRSEGVPVDLAELEPRIGAPPEGGRSMRELREVAQGFGLQLVGVRLDGAAEAMDRPMILHLNRGNHGHFVVVRPVGRSGKLVQVLDNGRPPMVIDAEELAGSKEWSGLALVPVPGRWGVDIAALIVLVVALAVIIVTGRRIAASKRSAATPPPAPSNQLTN